MKKLSGKQQIGLPRIISLKEFVMGAWREATQLSYLLTHVPHVNLPHFLSSEIKKGEQESRKNEGMDAVNNKELEECIFYFTMKQQLGE